MKKAIIGGILLLASMGSSGTVFAQNVSSSPAKTENIACVVSAVGKREDALKAAYTQFASAISAALDQRKTDLLAAWSLTTAQSRHQARAAAWRKFGVSARTAKYALKKSIRTTWSQFGTDRKACGSKEAAEEGSHSNDVGF